MIFHSYVIALNSIEKDDHADLFLQMVDHSPEEFFSLLCKMDNLTLKIRSNNPCYTPLTEIKKLINYYNSNNKDLIILF